MKVSVLLAVYNGEKTLKETIESILSQTYKDLEIMAVDDGSTDSSAEIIKSFSDPRVRYFKHKNSGAPAAPRNFAIQNSSGEMLALCDQDDLWYPEKLEKQLSAYENSEHKKEVGIIYCQADLIDEKDKKTGESEEVFAGFLSPSAAFTNLIYGDFIRACSAMFPKKVVEEVGLLNPSLKGNDEYDLWLRITQKYGTLGVPEKLCAWRRFDQSFSIKVSRVYVENEKIFARLEQEKPTDELVKIGHGRNINRVMVAAVLEKNKTLAKEYAVKAKTFPVSLKGKVVAYLIRNHYEWAEKILGNYQKNDGISI